VWPGAKGSSAGPTGTQPSGASGGIGFVPSHGRVTDALRPAWASWIPGTAPIRAIIAARRASASVCASDQMPRQPGVIRACGATWVASVMTMPAPPAARAPRCCRCQSFGRPSSAEYWHIGESAIRFRAVTDRKLIGWNRGGRLSRTSTRRSVSRIGASAGEGKASVAAQALRRKRGGVLAETACGQREVGRTSPRSIRNALSTIGLSRSGLLSLISTASPGSASRSLRSASP